MITRAISGAGCMAIAVFGAWGQETAKVPEFEVASIKVSEPLNMGAMMASGKVQIRMGCTGGPGTADPGRLVCNGTPVKMLLVKAYGVKNYQVIGPNWLDSERYDITAKVPEGTTAEQFNLMLQKLIADRFQMTTHKETKDLPMYALTVGKSGHKLKEPKEDDKESPMDAMMSGKLPPPPAGGGGGGNVGFVMMSGGGPGGPGGAPGARRNGIMMTMRSGLFELVGKKATVSSLADMLSNQLSRPVVDQTNIQGEYDFTLDFAPDDTMGSRMGGMMPGGMMPGGMPPGAMGGRAGGDGHSPAGDASEPSNAQSLFTAIQSQLGLKLDARKGPVETIVVDKGEKLPTEN